MMYIFNAQEVFEMAIQIEENGAEFYRSAGGTKENSIDREFFEALARMEDRHRVSFETMRKQIPEPEKTQIIFDLEEESLYLKAMADSHRGEGDPAVLHVLTGKETIEEIITKAIGLEKESILFYLGLKDTVPLKDGQEKVNNIIEEERKHIVQLNEFLKIAKKTAL